MPLLALATSAATSPQPLITDLRNVRNSRVSVRVQDGRCMHGAVAGTGANGFVGFHSSHNKHERDGRLCTPPRY